MKSDFLINHSLIICLAEFLAKLDRSQLRKKTAYLYIPKFKISSSHQLHDNLKELGTNLNIAEG
jgi:hypothetical protein